MNGYNTALLKRERNVEYAFCERGNHINEAVNLITKILSDVKGEQNE